MSATDGCGDQWHSSTSTSLRWGLVTWTSGNVSARLPDSNLLVIKPSGVALTT